MKVLTIHDIGGRRYYYSLEDNVADSLDLGKENIEFETIEGMEISLNRSNVVFLAIGEYFFMLPDNIPSSP